VIGRDPRADISFDDNDLSRRHVYIQVVQGRAFWMDLESRTGTLGGDGAAQKAGWLEQGLPITIGPLSVSRPLPVDAADEPAQRPLTARESPLVALSYGRNPLPNVALEFLNGPTRGELWPMHRVMALIGSSKTCKFRLSDRSVSQFHASMIRTTDGLWIIDLRGVASIVVNETPVRCIRLADGDILGIGRYRIRVRYQMWERPSRDRSASGSSVDTRRPRHSVVSHSRDLSLIDHSGSDLAAYQPGANSSPSVSGELASLSGAQNSGVAWIAADSHYPTRIEDPALSQAAIAPLLNQFSIMQQQMFDQFQQSMGMLVQMFGTMHRDQMEVIHEELGRLKELTSELHSLKVELSHRPVQERPRVEPEPVSSVPDIDQLERMLANAKGAGATRAVPLGPPAPPVSATPSARPDSGETPRSRPTSAPFVSGPPLTALQVAELTGFKATSTPTTDPALSKLNTVPQPQPTPNKATAAAPRANAGGSPQAKPMAPDGGDEPNSVAWLHQRIMTLQRERETRWQKILKLIPGNS
jgi:pSer/pThr/pTyr-binding forkhead associated (FHA) protein